MHYLNLDDIVAINEVVVEETSGAIGLRELGLLESIIYKPATRRGDEELYPNMWLKAAVLYEAIVNYHVFVDGNKRTAFASMARFLAINGYGVKVTDKEIEDYTINIAVTNPALESIATWLKAHSKKQ